MIRRIKLIAAVLAIVLIPVALITFSIWRTVSRIDDCRLLGHGTLYCVVVWGGR